MVAMAVLAGATVAQVKVIAAAAAATANTKRVFPYPAYVSRWYVYTVWHSMRFITYA